MATSTPATETAKSLFESMSDDRLVTIHIGQDYSASPLLIQQSIICAASPFFKATFTGDFEEGQKGFLHLPDDDIQAWHIFIHWLLRGKIPHDQGLAVIKAWSLGDKYGIPQLQDDAMFALFEEFDYDEKESLRDMKEAFAMCPQGSLVRKFLADQVVMFTGGQTRHMPREVAATLMTWADFDAVLEDPGNCKDILDAMVRKDRFGEDMWNWKEGSNGAGKPMWFRYMVCEDGPSQVEFHGWLNLTNGWLSF